MKASKQLIDFIKDKERFVPGKYEDPTGTATIGYGDTGGDMSAPISEFEASKRLEERVAIAERELAPFINRANLSQGQQDALIDMHYNMGMPELINTGLIDLVNSGNDDEVARSILKYNKARDKKTGQVVVLPGLVDRAEARARMWKEGQVIVPMVAEESYKQPFDLNDPDALEASLKMFESSQDQQLEISDDELDSSIKEFEMGQPRRQPDSGLKVASEAADIEDLKRVQEARKISKETGAPEAIVLGMMTEGYRPAEIRAKARIGDIERHSPAAARWAKDPQNFAVLQETGDWPMEVEAAAKDLKSDKSDLSRAADQGLLTMAEAATSLGLLLGTVTKEEAIEIFEALDQEKLNSMVHNRDLQDLRKKWEDYIKKGGSLWDVISYTAERPQALALQSVESAITSAVPFAFSLGGIVAPPTLPYAVGGAFLSGGAIAYGTKFRENLEQFRDSKTGRLNLDQAFADPDQVARWKTEAGIYGGVMGVFDAAFGLVAGKIFPKLAAKGMAGKVAGGALEIASGPVNEGASEYAATSAADVYTGKINTKKNEENVRAAIIEGVMSIPVEGTYGPITSAVRAAPEVKIKARKTVQLATDGVKALKDTAALSNLRAKVEKFRPQFPDQAASLVNEVVAPGPSPEAIDLDTFETAFDTLEEKVSSEIKSDTPDKGMVYISPSEWIAHFDKKGLDPLTMIQNFGPDVHEDFIRNIDADTSVAIPMQDWVSMVIEDQELDLIARIEGNKDNAHEASELMEALDENPVMLFRDDELPPIPGMEGEPEVPLEAVPMTIIEVAKEEAAAILRPVDLVGKFANDEEKQVFGGLKRKLQKIGTELSMEKEAVEAFADVQFGRLKHRAAVTGRSIKEMYENNAIGIYDRPGASHLGFFETNRIIGEKTKLMFNKGTKNNIDVVIHEFGHSWLHEMAEDFHFVKGLDPATMTEAQREYSMAMDKFAELMGLNNVQEILNLPKEQYRKIHETFAQTAELYFLEGKYENNKIKEVMETFRKWIVDTINYIKKMAGRYPTLQLNAEVERMFEGILGTSAKIEEEVIPMFTSQLFPDEFLGVTKKKDGTYTLSEEALRYKEVLADAQTEAVGETYFKSFKKNLRAREKEIREAMARITEESIRDVDALPAMQFLKSVEAMHQDYKDKKIDYDPRLSYESVQKELLAGNEADTAWLKSQLPSAVMTGKKKGGVDVRDFMYQNQISDPSIILELLIQTTKREQMIEARIKERIETEFPVTKSDEEIHEIAVEAVNGKGKEKLLMLELKILADKGLTAYKNMASKLMSPPTGINKVAVEDIEYEAEALVLDAGAVKFSPDKFLRDTHRLAREAARAFKKNDIIEAFNYKRREAVAFMAYKQAKFAQKEIGMARHLARLILKYAPNREAMRRLDTDVMKFGYHLVNAVNAGQAIPKFSDFRLSSYSGVLESHAMKMEELRTELLETMQSRTGKNISVEAAIAYGELLKHIMFVAKQAKEIELAGNKTLIEDAEAEVLSIDPEGPVVSYEKDWWFSASRRRVSNHKVSTGLASLYKDQQEYAASVFGKVLGDVRDGEAKVSLDVNDAERRLYEAFKKIVKSGPKKTTKETIFAPLKRLQGSKPIIAPEIEFTFNNEGELLMALATALGSESGKVRFLTSINPQTGKPIADYNFQTGELESSKFDAMVDRMIADGTLRKEHFEFFQEMWSIFDALHPRVADVMRKTDGINMGKIEAKPFSNQFGEWTGGYVPVAEDTPIDESMIKKGLLNVDTNGVEMLQLYPTMSTGLTKKRNKVSNAPLNLDARKVLNYVSAASKIANLRIPMKTMGTILKRPEVAARLEQRRPGFIKNVVTPWFDYTVDQVYTDPDKNIVHSIFGKLRKNTNTVMYLGGLMTPVRQFYGLLPSAQRVGAKNLRKSLAKMGSIAKGRELMTQIRAKSPFMKERAEGVLRKFVKDHDVLETNFDWWSTSVEWKDKLTYMLAQATQNIVDVATWDAAYNKAMDEGLDEKSAIRFADQSVTDTQSSPNVSDMSAIQRGDNFYRLLTMVTSVPIAMHNMIAEEMMRTDSGREKLKIAAGMGSILLALPFVLESATDYDSDDEEKDDIGDILQIFANKSAAGFLDHAFPIVSRPLTGYMTFNNPSISPALSKLTNAARAPGIASNTAQGVDITAKEMALLLETITLFTGIPTSVAGRALRFGDNLTPESSKRSLTRRRRRQLRRIRRSR